MLSDETILKIRAAYSGMVEHLDSQVGLAYDAYMSYLQRSGRSGVFIYTSDHGETLGERNKFGKVCMYDSSCRVPLVFSGAGIAEDAVCRGSVSLLDLGHTICDIAGAETLPHWDGSSLTSSLATGTDDERRTVVSETLFDGGARLFPGRMVRRGRWKLVTYHPLRRKDLLFDIDRDPYELSNIIADFPHVALELRSIAVYRRRRSLVLYRLSWYQSVSTRVSSWRLGACSGADQRFVSSPGSSSRL